MQRKAIAFGDFRLFPAERLLERSGEPFVLPSRALDLLIALAERPQEVVSKRQLLELVWPGSAVDEAGLRVHMTTLRRALGDGVDGLRYIVNIHGRGYSFVAPLGQGDGAENTPFRAPAPETLPPALNRMIGRDAAVAEISALARTNRLVTITGCGGIGKTTAAVAAGHALNAEFDGAVHFVDLGMLSDPALLTSAIASTLECAAPQDLSHNGLSALIRDKRLLLIVDNCEHLVDAVATIAAHLRRENPGAFLLATSREPLGVDGEYVYSLPPLNFPKTETGISPEDARCYSAIELFMERAATGGHPLGSDDATIFLVAELCRKLDGVPAAIELIASHVSTFGLDHIAELMNDLLTMEWAVRRSAPARHRSLGALIEWSYGLLSECEQVVLRKLAIFVGHFELEAALAIIGPSRRSDWKPANAIGALVRKSLLYPVKVGTGAPCYRMLEATRAYALSRLQESGDANETARRHAIFFSQSRDKGDPTSTLANIRVALEWGFSDKGDPLLATDLAAHASRHLIELSLFDECYRWCHQALPVAIKAKDRPDLELTLREALGIATSFMRGNNLEARAEFERGLYLAKQSGCLSRQFQLTAGLNLHFTRVGDLHAALTAASDCGAIARTTLDPSHLVTADWMLGVTHHILGNQSSARHFCELGFHRDGDGNAHSRYAGYDHRVRAYVALARALWLSGHPDQAVIRASQGMEDAKNRGNPVDICISLFYSAKIYLWRGEWGTAGEIIETLVALADKHSIWLYHSLGLGLKGELLFRTGNPRPGITLMHQALAASRAAHHVLFLASQSVALAEALAAVGQIEPALALLDEGLESSNDGPACAHFPEMLRLKGVLLGQHAENRQAEALVCFSEAIHTARHQCAAAWELRAVTSLIEVLGDRRSSDLGDLASLYRRFSEGLDTLDLRTARGVLDIYSSPVTPTHLATECPLAGTAKKIQLSR